MKRRRDVAKRMKGKELTLEINEGIKRRILELYAQNIPTERICVMTNMPKEVVMTVIQSHLSLGKY
jgi:hypothetical protein